MPARSGWDAFCSPVQAGANYRLIESEVVRNPCERRLHNRTRPHQLN